MKKVSPLGAARQQQRLQIMQRACDTYDKFLNPDRNQPHETVIEGLRALSAMQRSAGLTIEAEKTLSKASSLQNIAEKQKLRAAEQDSRSPDAARNSSSTKLVKKWCDDD